MRGAALALLAATALALPAHASRREHAPVVVELFTAQGCTSCAQADRLLGELADRKGVIALTFPVENWDDLFGWRDTFAKEAFTARQQAYADRLRLREIYIPEFVVNGRREAPGLKRDEIEALIGKAAEDGRGPAPPPKVRILRHGTRIQVGSGEAPRGGAEVWLVRYDPKTREVRVRTGENRGKLVVQRNVVRELVRLGSWNGRARSYAAPAPGDDGLKTVVLLQAAHGGRILAVHAAT